MTNFNCDIFCERVNSLFGSMGQMELSEKIGISQGVISAIKNKKVKAPGADTIFRIANYFNVSADYLLGLSDVQTRDLETKELCQALGLSEDAIWTLQQAKNMCFDLEECRINLRDTISTFLASVSALPMFTDMLIMQWNAIMQNKLDTNTMFNKPTSDELRIKADDWLSYRDSIELELFRATKEFQKIAEEMVDRVAAPSDPEDGIKLEMLKAQARKNLSEMTKRRSNEKT